MKNSQSEPKLLPIGNIRRIPDCGKVQLKASKTIRTKTRDRAGQDADGNRRGVAKEGGRE